MFPGLQKYLLLIIDFWDMIAVWGLKSGVDEELCHGS